MTHTVLPPSQMTRRWVRVTCPCCGKAYVEVEIVRGDLPEDPTAWEVDDINPDCGCADYLDTKGFGRAFEDYMERLAEEAAA